MSKTDPMWVFENYGEAAELIDEHEAVIAQQATRIAELEKFADEANAQMLEAFAERDQAMKAQPSGVVLPERDDSLGAAERDEYANGYRHGWNAYHDAAKDRLNSTPTCAGVVLPTVEQITEALDDVTCFHDLSAELIAPALLENLRAMIGSTHAGSGVVPPERNGADPIFPFDRGFNACRAQAVPVVSSRLTTACKACGGARRVDIGTVCDSWVECSECRDQQKESGDE